MPLHLVLLAALALLAVVVGFGLAWRWLDKHRARIVERTQVLWQRLVTAPGLQRLKVRYPRLWTFVAARFARGEYLGLHLTVGFLISLAALWLFGVVTEGVIEREQITQFDVALLDWLRGHATPTGYAAFGVISSLGGLPAMTVLAVGVGLLLAIQRRWIPLGGWAAALAGGGLLDVALKVLIRRPRPSDAVTFIAHPSWSFPSGHAMGSLVGYGMLAYVLVLLWRRRRRTQVAIVVGAALLIVAIGVSRLYLGVHYFSDVVGGYAAGVLWLSACISGVEVARRRPDPRA